MIDQRHIPEGQVPCITALAPRGPRPSPHPDFDTLGYRLSTFYGYSAANPFTSSIRFTGSGA